MREIIQAFYKQKDGWESRKPIRQRLTMSGKEANIAAFLSLGERLVLKVELRPAYGVSPFPSYFVSGGVSIATSFLVLVHIVHPMLGVYIKKSL